MKLLFIILLGLCFGSFVNALVWRMHEQSKPKSKRAAKDGELSITRGRSMCPYCKHTLASKDLLPVVSWLSLGGKCRYCHKSISWQYPFVEILTAILFAVAYQSLHTSKTDGLFLISFVSLLATIVIGMALAIYDFKWMLLPDRLVRILAIPGIAYATTQIAHSSNIPRSLVSLIVAVFISGGLFYLLYQISDGKWIGGGDVKMGLVLGLFLLTPLNAVMMLFGASLLGCMYAVVLILIGKYKKGVHIPFGPSLLLATYVIIVFGVQIVNYYKNLLLL